MTTLETFEINRLFEYVGVEGLALRYFAVFDTPVGRVQTRVYKEAHSKTGAEKNKAGKLWAAGDLFVSPLTAPPTPDARPCWVPIISLGHAEIRAHDVPISDDLTEEHMDALRADAAQILERTVMVLDPSLTPTNAMAAA